MTPSSLILFLHVFATLLPVASFVAIILFRKRGLMGERSAYLATGAMAVSFAACLLAVILWMLNEPGTIVRNLPWIPLGGTPEGGADWLYLGAMIDSLTIAMMAMVSLIAFLVHLYSIGYMHGDKLYERFFAYLSLFTFSMMGIVISNSLMQMFVFWELVGLTSYLLIGFWFEKRGPQLACKKAFVMNRIGDAGFLVGFGILFYQLGGNVLLPAAEGAGHLSMLGALTKPLDAGGMGISLTSPPTWLTIAGIGLFCGAIGKSAQFPLHTWLPDAMEGPTPVSSIVHSATMVAAGVYLTGRIYPILTPDAHLFVATIGLITLVMAACMAMVMTDIKRVLAYSTLSQLGYMVLGLGVGAWTFALFHLITHAFFKCCLFQCSGSVIHAAHHQQDMRYYGGLKDKMPITCACYAVCTLAIAGASIPFSAAMIEGGIGLSGFYSKDGIIAGAFEYGAAMQDIGSWAYVFWLGPVVIAFVTPFYMARSFALTFLGKPRDQHLYDHAHEAPKTMTIPQIVLAFFAVVSGWFLWKDLIVGAEPAVDTILTAKVLEADGAHGMHLTHLWLLYGFAWIIALGAGLWMYKDGFKHSEKIVRIPVVRQLYTWAYNKFYFDGLYDAFAVSLTKIFAIIIGMFDKHFVDRLVELVAYSTRFAAWIVGKFDLRAVDGAVNGAASFAQNSGQILRSTQVGRIRSYVLLLFASATVATLIVVTVVLVTG